MPEIYGWSEDNLSLTTQRDREMTPAATFDLFDRNSGYFTSTGAVTNGSIFFSIFVPRSSLTFTTMTIACANGGTDVGGTTRRAMGLFTVSGRSYTCVARTASDATIGNTANTLYARTLDTSGGFPSSYTINAGSTYAIGFFAYNTGGTYNGPSIVCGNSNQSIVSTLSPRTNDAITSQTDLPALNGSVTGTTNTPLRIWMRLS